MDRLTNRAADDRYFVMAASVPGMIASAEVLGAEVSMAPLMIDLLDPYDYGSALNRDSINQHFQQLNQGMEKTWLDQRPTVLAAFKAHNPGLTNEEYQRAVDLMMTPYQLQTVTPEPREACFPDLRHENVKRWAGPPEPACDATYREAYYKYRNANQAKYQSEHITDTSALNQFLNFAIASATDQKLRQEREEYFIYGGIALGIVVLALGILLFFYLRARLNP